MKTLLSTTLLRKPPPKLSRKLDFLGRLVVCDSGQSGRLSYKQPVSDEIKVVYGEVKLHYISREMGPTLTTFSPAHFYAIKSVNFGIIIYRNASRNFRLTRESLFLSKARFNSDSWREEQIKMRTIKSLLLIHFSHSYEVRKEAMYFRIV